MSHNVQLSVIGVGTRVDRACLAASVSEKRPGQAIETDAQKRHGPHGYTSLAAHHVPDLGVPNTFELQRAGHDPGPRARPVPRRNHRDQGGGHQPDLHDR